MSIPKNIHQIWIAPHSGMLDLPPDVKGNISQWTKTHPDFNIKLWSLEDVFKLVSDQEIENLISSDIIKLVNTCRFPAMQADIGRLIVLYLVGGFWVDLKITPKLQFMSRYLDKDLVLVEHFPKPDAPDPTRSKLLINSFFGCSQRSIFIKNCLILALKNVRSKTADVWRATGPRVFMTVREEMFADLYEKNYDSVSLLKANEFWEVMVGFGYSSYNSGGFHWFERSKNEPLYND